MAEGRAKKPRIRKTAPTVRQKMEEAQAKAEKSQSKPPRRVKIKLPSVVRGRHLKNNKVFARLAPVLAPVKKILSRIAPRYLANAWRELRQVQWTTRRETWRLTLAVFIFAIVFGALVAGVDKTLDEIFKKLVLK